MRRRLFAAVSMTALLSAPALAQEVTIDDERTEPVDTATVGASDSPANLIIGSNGRVRLTNQPGPAVRVNSDNTLTTAATSQINIEDVNADGDNILLSDAVGVQVDPGVTTDIEHGGAINLLDSYVAEASDSDLIDTDDDGVPDSPDSEVDGAFAEDLRKIGVLVGSLDTNFAPTVGQAGVTGTIDLAVGSGVSVEGQQSYGLRVAADVTGDVFANGRVSITGENSTGVAIEGNVSGDVQVARVVAAVPDGQGVDIQGDIGGGLRFVDEMTITGYRTSSRLSEQAMALFDENDDDLDSNSAIIIAGNVVDGVFFARGAQIRHRSGSGAGVNIGSGGQTLNIGTTKLPDDFDVSADDADQDDLRDTYDYAIINRGTVDSSGIFDGKDNTAFFIAGRDDQNQLRAVILEGLGMRNEGRIAATAYDASAVGLRFGEGAEAQTLTNTGTIEGRAALGYESDGFVDDDYRNISAYAIVMDEGSAIREILNEGGVIFASVQQGADPSAGGATAITANSGSLEQIVNQGLIGASVLGSAPDDVGETDPSTVAINASGHDNGLAVIQRARTDENGDQVTDGITIAGDVIFGDGDDSLELLAGDLNGDVFFGAGADRLVINGAELNGAINDSDANLTIDVTNGRIVLTGSDSVALTDAVFNDGGVLDIQIDTASRSGAFVDAFGTVTFAQGSDLQVSLGGLIENVQAFELVAAGTLDIQDSAVLTATEAPFLYNAEIRTADGDANTLILSLTRKTADELGMNASQAAAYDEAFAAMTAINELGNAFAAIRSSEGFFGAYDQLLPEYASSAIQFALASNDAATGALSSRLRNARLSPDELAGVWVQEFGYFADRNATSFGPGYRGQGVGLAMGIDRPVGPFYAMGFHLVGAASEVEEIEGFDEPMVAISGQVGTYAAIDLGGIDVSGSVGVGYDYFESERNILIDSFSTVNTAEWSGWHVTASAQAGRDYQVGTWTLRPEASLTWLSLFESGYTEQNEDPDFSQLALIVDDRESSVMTAAATFTVGRRFGTDISWWAPSVRIGYRGELLGEDMDTIAQFGDTGSPFTLQSEAMPGSGILGGFGLSAGSQYTTFTFAYDADVREDFVRHVARLVVRMTF